MRELLLTLSMAQPVAFAYEAAWQENVFMTIFWLVIVLALHIMANGEALKR